MFFLSLVDFGQSNFLSCIMVNLNTCVDIMYLPETASNGVENGVS